MIEARLQRGREYLAAHGVELRDQQLQGLYEAMSKGPAVQYQQGDFIAYNEGMGERGYGRVELHEFDLCTVTPYHGGRKEFENYTVRVAASDVFRLSTPEKAQSYYLQRSGHPQP